jgi:hypothetical protein
MIEKEITIPKNITIKGILKSTKYISFLQDLRNSINLLLFGLGGIILVDIISGNGYLIIWHMLSLLIVSVFVSQFLHMEWKNDILEKTKDHTYIVKLDEAGVQIINKPKNHRWDDYLYYVEYEDYLLIMNKEVGISFLPITPELSDVIEYAKKKIPNKVNAHGNF